MADSKLFNCAHYLIVHKVLPTDSPIYTFTRKAPSLSAS